MLPKVFAAEKSYWKNLAQFVKILEQSETMIHIWAANSVAAMQGIVFLTYFNIIAGTYVETWCMTLVDVSFSVSFKLSLKLLKNFPAPPFTISNSPPP